jgi:NAD(P)H dehydrogenase (quinone)
MRVAVTGAAGRLGGQIVRLLSEDHETVAMTRAVADYDDPRALRAALDGVQTLVFVSSDGPITDVMRHHENIVGAAAASAVEHIAALSSLDADLASPFVYADMAARTEELLRESGCGYSVARASIYTEFFLHWLTAARSSGQVRLPAGDGRISLVSREDVGRCLAALAQSEPTGATHAITGPEALDLDQIAAVAAGTWGVPVEYVELTPHEYAAETAAAGEEAWWLYAYSSMFGSIREHRWEEVSDGVRRLTGRPAASPAVVLEAHA